MGGNTVIFKPDGIDVSISSFEGRNEEGLYHRPVISTVNITCCSYVISEKIGPNDLALMHQDHTKPQLIDRPYLAVLPIFTTVLGNDMLSRKPYKSNVNHHRYSIL